MSTRSWLFGIAILLLAGAWPGAGSVCAQTAPAAQPPDTPAQPAPPRLSYKFGIPPWQKGQSVDDIRSRYKPMLEKLSGEVGIDFTIVGTKDYDEMAELLYTGKVQLASISPAPFVIAERKQPGIRMLVTELSWDPDRTRKSDSYYSHIVCLKSRADLTTLADLKGKNFGFVTRKSTSGYQVPTALLRERGLDAEQFFGKIFFLDSHPRVTDAVVAGSIDAGATWSFNLEEAIRKHGDVFKILLSSPPIPNVGIAMHPSVPADVQDQIKKALVNMDPAVLEGLSAAGYVVRPNSFYDPIRAIVQE